MGSERQLQERAIIEGPEAFSVARISAANSLIHEELFGPYILRVRGGLGSFSVGTSAALLYDGKTVHHTFKIASWVWLGEQLALQGARIWAGAILDNETMAGKDIAKGCA